MSEKSKIDFEHYAWEDARIEKGLSDFAVTISGHGSEPLMAICTLNNDRINLDVPIEENGEDEKIKLAASNNAKILESVEPKNIIAHLGIPVNKSDPKLEHSNEDKPWSEVSERFTYIPSDQKNPHTLISVTARNIRDKDGKVSRTLRIICFPNPLHKIASPRWLRKKDKPAKPEEDRLDFQTVTYLREDYSIAVSPSSWSKSTEADPTTDHPIA